MKLEGSQWASKGIKPRHELTILDMNQKLTYSLNQHVEHVSYSLCSALSMIERYIRPGPHPQ